MELRLVRRRGGSSAAARRWRPRLEVLEDRSLLSTAFEVTSDADSGAGTLRAALAATNPNVTTPEVISFASGVNDITLATPLEAKGPAQITADPNHPVTVSGNGTTAILTVDAGTVTLNGVNLTQGFAPGGSGAVVVDPGAKLVMQNASVTDVRNTTGAGVLVLNGGALELDNMVFQDNGVESVVTQANTRSDLTHVVFNHNSTTAVENDGIMLWVYGAVTDNTTSRGAVYNAQTLDLNTVTFSGNTASGEGEFAGRFWGSALTAFSTEGGYTNLFNVQLEGNKNGYAFVAGLGFNSDAVLDEVTFDGNDGAIHAEGVQSPGSTSLPTGHLALDFTEVKNNNSVGATVLVNDAGLYMNGVSVHDNASTTAGAVAANPGSSNDLFMLGSTIDGNKGGNSGGGLALTLPGGVAGNIFSSTIADNRITQGSGANVYVSGTGGQNNPGVLTLIADTIVRGTIDGGSGSGGGLDDQGVVYVSPTDTIVAQNSVRGVPNDVAFGGGAQAYFTSGGNNLFGVGIPGLKPTDQSGTTANPLDAGLGQFGNYVTNQVAGYPVVETYPVVRGGAAYQRGAVPVSIEGENGETLAVHAVISVGATNITVAPTTPPGGTTTPPGGTTTPPGGTTTPPGGTTTPPGGTTTPPGGTTTPPGGTTTPPGGTTTPPGGTTTPPSVVLHVSGHALSLGAVHPKGSITFRVGGVNHRVVGSVIYQFTPRRPVKVIEHRGRHTVVLIVSAGFKLEVDGDPSEVPILNDLAFAALGLRKRA